MRVKNTGVARAPFVRGASKPKPRKLIHDQNLNDGLVSRAAFEQLTFWAERETGSFVYFVQEYEGPVKIGMAMNPVGRLASLQTGNPRPLTLEHVLCGGRLLEDALHRHFSEASMARGEWFDASMAPAILAFAEGLANAQIHAYDKRKGQTIAQFSHLVRYAGTL